MEIVKKTRITESIVKFSGATYKRLITKEILAGKVISTTAEWKVQVGYDWKNVRYSRELEELYDNVKSIL